MDKQLKTGIVASLIVSLAVIIFIQPILHFLWRVILNVGGILYQGYVDRIYRNAAMASGNPYGRDTFLALFVVFLMVAIFWTLDRAKVDQPAPGFDTFMERAVLLTVLIGFLIMIERVAIHSGTAEIAESFTQRLTVMAPAISDSEYKILKARWANMRGKADYDALVVAMDKRATELGVNLPPVRKP